MRGWTGLLHLIVTVAMVATLAGCQPGGALTPAANTTRDDSTPVQTLPDPGSAWGHLPLYFVANHGQVDSQVAFTTHQGNLSAYFTPGSVTFGLAGGTPIVDESVRMRFGPDAPGRPSERWAVGLDFVGATNAQATGADQTEAIVSYFRGGPDEWITAVPTYAGVTYHQVWPGIDVAYDGQHGRLKSSYLVRPGADPSQIRLAYRGATDVRVSEQGNLEVVTGLGVLRESAPVAYQEIDGRRVPVAATYDLAADADVGVYEYGFRLGTYDARLPLVIDPSIVYAGYIGGSGSDIAYAVAVDSAGSAYVTGFTGTSDGSFPTKVGPDLIINNADAFVTKVTPDGTGLVYSGYIGGGNVEYGYGIAVDSGGNAYVTGNTTSSVAQGFPLVGGPMLTSFGNGDSYITKVNAAGTGLVYSGYISGSGNEVGYGVAVDSSNRAYVAGYVIFSGTNFPVVGGPGGTFHDTDVFISRIKADGSGFDYSGIFGGTGQDIAYGVAVDSAGSAYVTGTTAAKPSDGFPATVGPSTTLKGNRDGFVAKLKPDGSGFLYAGYVGGGGDDFGHAIAVDSAGSAYITGITSSDETSFPVAIGPDLTYNAGSDAFVAKVKTDGTGLVYAGYIGSSGQDSGTGIAVDSAGNAYVAGWTPGNFTFPVIGGPGVEAKGGIDAFVAKVRADGSALVYSGLMGGPGFDEASGIAIDSAGNAYVAGIVESAEDTFPVKVGPDLTIGRSGGNPTQDGFIAKINNVDPSADLSVSIASTPDPVIVGSTLTYTITIANAGPSPATSVVLTDTLPAGLSFKTRSASQGGCIGTNVQTCTLGTILSGASATVTIAITPTQAGSLLNTASITGLPTTDPTPNDHTTTATNTAGDVPTATPTPTLTPTTAPTLTPTPTTVPRACSPRPNVGVTVISVAVGRLRATITAGTAPATPANTLHSVRSLPTSTGRVDVPGGPTNLTGAFTLPLPSRATQVTFDVLPAPGTQAGTVFLEIVDDCGAWQTLVGGGPSAFGAASFSAGQPAPAATPRP